MALTAAGEESVMPAPHPPEFRRKAIDLARRPVATVARVAKALGMPDGRIHPLLNLRRFAIKQARS